MIGWWWLHWGLGYYEWNQEWSGHSVYKTIHVIQVGPFWYKWEN